eukprot:TRINITY_DN4353_c0_g1_i1.p2 TRINITY_DN4353_c0_g1~~TRINITY_DN4353_c0_g1_i1.p2  ORF type:complete len:133 (-),score=30.86 TRINITY_DN4353_c0_g1_i1:350-748(-)
MCIRDRSQWSFESYQKIEPILFEQETPVAWDRMKDIFEEMINSNLKSSSSIRNVRCIIDQKQRNEESQEQSEQQQSQQSQSQEEYQINEEKESINENEIQLEILPNVIPIQQSLIPQSPNKDQKKQQQQQQK